jgi:cobalt/nickel transport system permease protein
MSSGHGAAPSASRLRGPLTRRPGTAKVLVLVAVLLAVGLTPNRHLSWLVGWLVAAAAVAALAFVEWRSVARRLVLDVPLVVLGVAEALTGRGPHVVVAGLTLSRPGLTVGAAVLLKATIGVVAVSAVAACTTVPETVAALRRLHAPQWFCTLLALAHRQLDVLRDDLHRLRLAAGLRHPDGGWRARWSVGGRALAALFIRSADRADRLQLAAELRGGTLEEVVSA